METMEKPKTITRDKTMKSLQKKNMEMELQAKQDKERIAHLESLTDNKKPEDNTKGQSLDIPIARYEFLNIADPGQAFDATHGMVETVGGKVIHTRYRCDDSDIISLPVSYAEALNKISHPNIKWVKKEGQDKSVKVKTHKIRWRFSRV